MWIALLIALLPLIEMLLKLFLENRRPAIAARLRTALKRCNEAASKLTPAERKKHKRLLERLAAVNATARSVGLGE